MAGFRTRISELNNDYDLNLGYKIKKGVNKFGNSFIYHEHYLTNKDKAIDLYKTMTKDNRDSFKCKFKRKEATMKR